MYLCLMKRKIETSCPILEIQYFPARKFSLLNFVPSFIDFDFDLMQLTLYYWAFLSRCSTGGFPPPSIKFDPDILEHWNLEG